MALSNVQKLAYSVGHILNDLCAAMWFSYLLIFFHKILEFSNSLSGYVLLIGQIADGIATPFVGYESDKSTIHCKYGRRKSWHLVGTFCVAIAFPLLFMRCVTCEDETAQYAQFIYYVPLVVIFQFGWASTQINHLALIPDIVTCDQENVDLNSYRYGFTVASSILVYSIAWLVLGMPGSASSVNEQDLSSKDASSFRTLVLAVVGTGVVFSLIFHLILKEKPRPRDEMHNSYEKVEAAQVSVKEQKKDCTETSPLLGNSKSKTEITPPNNRQLHWHEWFKKPRFYVIALLYMFTRLVVNLSQVYMPMYLIDTLSLHKKYIAIVPLVTFGSSFLCTFVIRQLTKFLKHEPTFFAGTLFVLGSCVWAHFIQEGSNQVFGQAVLVGIGTSMMLVMALSMTTALIGPNSGTGAFVYGAMSLTDKLSNGVAVVLVQHLNPCPYDCAECANYFRIVMSYLIGGLTVAAIASLGLVVFIKHYTKKHTAMLIEGDSAIETSEGSSIET